MQVSVQTVTSTSAAGVMVRLKQEARAELVEQAAAVLSWSRRLGVASQYQEAVPGAQADLERAQAEAAQATAAVATANAGFVAEQSKLRVLESKYRELPRSNTRMMRGGVFDFRTNTYTDAPLAPGVQEGEVAVAVAQRAVEEQEGQVEATRRGLQRATEKATLTERRLSEAKERLSALTRVAADLSAWPRPEVPALLALLGLLQEGRDA